MYISCTCVHVYILCVVGGFHLFIVFTSTRTIRYSDSTLFFHLQYSATNQETPKYFAIIRAFPRNTPNASLKLIDIFIIHHFEMILARAWPNISLHLSNSNRGSSGLASARELEQKGPILSPSKYIMNGLATEKKEYSSLSQESILGNLAGFEANLTIKHV